MPDGIALLDKLLVALGRFRVRAHSLSLLRLCGVQPPILNPLCLMEFPHYLAALDSLIDGFLVVSVLLTALCAHLGGLMAKLGVVAGRCVAIRCKLKKRDTYCNSQG